MEEKTQRSPTLFSNESHAAFCSAVAVSDEALDVRR